MKTVNILAGKPYAVEIGRGLLADAGAKIARAHKNCRAAVISDDHVFPLYGKALKSSLAGAGISSETFVFPHGEHSKTPETWLSAIRFLAENGFTRTDVVVALGGGVVGDLAGFAAASYLRGIAFYQIPTTFLSMLDASVGGKTGVDLAQGKNLLGAFWQPDGVFIDLDVLSTLADDVFSDGTAEAIKTGILFDAALFARLENGDFRDDLAEILFVCVSHKARVVEADEREGGLRKLLNLGHTLGHAVEKIHNYEMRHGQAVAVGTCMIARAAAQKGLLGAQAAERIERAFTQNGLPTTTKDDPQAIARAALSDKKRAGGQITLVVPREIGRCELLHIPVENLCKWSRA